jgi:hypothetical protein
VRAGRRFAGPNRWRANLPGFREAVLAYTDAVDALGRKLLPLCATALGLPSDTFDGAFAESQFSFRLTHYPPVAAEANQFGIAPHTDANCMTFLAQSEAPGLRVRMPDGTWVGHRDRVPAHLPGIGQPTALSAHHLRGVPRLVVRRQLQRRAPARRDLNRTRAAHRRSRLATGWW